MRARKFWFWVPLLIFCMGIMGAGPKAEGALKEVRLLTSAGTISPLLSMITVAQYNGYFKEEGIKVKLTPVLGSATSIQMLTGGQVDFVMASPDPLVKATGRDPNLGLVDVYTFVRSHFFPMAVLPDSPIKSIKELAGKKIGVPSLGSGAVFAAKLMLKDEGVAPDSVKLVPIGHGPQAWKMVKEGSVDAVCHWDGGFAIMESIGGKFRYFPKTKTIKKLFGTGVISRREFVEKNPEAVRGFLRAFTKGLIFMAENPEAAIKIHWKMYPGTKRKNIERTLHLLNVRNPKQRIEGTAAKKYGENIPAEWETIVEVYGLTGKLDPKTLYTNEFIDYANDFDIEAFKKEVRAFKVD